MLWDLVSHPEASLNTQDRFREDSYIVKFYAHISDKNPSDYFHECREQRSKISFNTDCKTSRQNWGTPVSKERKATTKTATPSKTTIYLLPMSY